MNLRYDTLEAAYAGEERHPDVVLRELGIEYERVKPVMMADTWFLYGCTHVPEKLPKFISALEPVE